MDIYKAWDRRVSVIQDAREPKHTHGGSEDPLDSQFVSGWERIEDATSRLLAIDIYCGRTAVPAYHKVKLCLDAVVRDVYNSENVQSTSASESTHRGA